MSRWPARVAPPPDALRPQPPEEMPEDWTLPAQDLALWTVEHFISPAGLFHVEEHAHLEQLTVGFLWSSADNRRKKKRVLATAAIPQAPPAGDAWARARYWQQLAEWFPEALPSYLVTFWTGCAELEDARFAQVMHHELRHCGVELDLFGSPKFSKSTGLPVPAVVPHDWEGFASEVALFGVLDPSLAEVIQAASKPPRFDAGAVAGVCGTCGRMAA